MMGTSPEETRQLHLEGALRMKEGKESRMDVYCFLFTDLLLITKSVKRVEKVKVIRQPLLINNVVCRELKDPGSFLLIYLNEFHSAVAAYSFQANSATQGRSWIDAIYNAQNQLQRLRSEEHVRQQVTTLQPRLDEEEESSNSAASSPCLPHKEQQSGSQSDGSTQTLSVAVIEETNGTEDSLSFRTDLGSPLGRAPSQSPRPYCLQVFALRSRSEDNLLQRLHQHSRTGAPGGAPDTPVQGRGERGISKSLSHLCKHGCQSTELLCQADEGRPDTSEECLSCSAPSGRLTDTLRRAEARHVQRAPVQSQQQELPPAAGPAVVGRTVRALPPAAQEGKCSLAGSGKEQDCGEPRTGRKSKGESHSHARQHKKLTLAQLYRIRTTLVLNSTLTASEV
ncbi:hypothetical protein SKAU_G00171260 [Synaphobranchus kaupii]|uniref:PH domain-containing protein n=1 Tax=Synaphobranchus kaupii TaxID=118154 RepID=A0A9Q1IZU3_SYNKA|nr:hypothetical protein SKAU_G00171260 [Synaphobranchus kaupii]